MGVRSPRWGFDLPNGDDHQAARAKVRVHSGHDDVGEARPEQVRAHLLRVKVRVRVRGRVNRTLVKPALSRLARTCFGLGLGSRTNPGGAGLGLGLGSRTNPKPNPNPAPPGRWRTRRGSRTPSRTASGSRRRREMPAGRRCPPALTLTLSNPNPNF